MSSLVGIGLTTFNAPGRLRKLLTVLRDQDLLHKPYLPLRVFEDPWKEAVQKPYERICAEFDVPFMRVPPGHRVAKAESGWSCMQGAIEFAVENTPEPWFIYLTDDVLPTPLAIHDLLVWTKLFDSTRVGAFQIPYWNYDELPEVAKPFGDAKARMWDEPHDWLRNVPRNPHWDNGGKPRPYVNVNGAGFVLRRAAWEQVGGFSQSTWCLDEDMGAKIWLRTPHIVVTVPGPPFVHFMGGSLDHPEHHFHCESCWKAAGWPDKTEVHRQTREAMAEKGCADEKNFDLWNRASETEVMGVAV